MRKHRKDIIMRIFKKFRNSAILASASAVSLTAGAVAFAEPDTKSIMVKVVEITLTLFRYVGIVLMVWGIGSLVLALKNDDPDSKVKAIWLIVVSAVLIVLKTLVQAVLGDNYSITDLPTA